MRWLDPLQPAADRHCRSDAGRCSAAYNPTADTWSLISTLGAPSGRAGHTVVWTGSGMPVFGGVSSGVPTASSYDPTVYYYVRSKPMYLYQRP